MLLEVPVFDINSALIAQKAGAHRIELCASMADGGITPSYGMILEARKLLQIPFFVMIRPRGGNFTYTNEEMLVMLSDIEFCRKHQIQGIVTGVLTQEGKVDKEACYRLTEAAGSMQLTFHRAFDRAIDPFEALEVIIEMGFHRILTSGQKETVMEGAQLIAQLVEKAENRIVIMPGSGLNEDNLTQLHAICKAKEYHSSAKIIHCQNSYQKEKQHFFTVCPQKVRKMLEIMSRVSSYS